MFHFFAQKQALSAVPPAPVSSVNPVHSLAGNLLRVAGVAAAGMLIGALTGSKRGVRKQCHHDRKLRTDLNEGQVDKMIMDSFPASDPASTY